MERKKNNLVRISCKDIIISDNNLKDNDYQLYQKLKNCILNRGQLKTILVCKTLDNRYECLEGSKIVKILKELDIDEVLAIDCGYLTENEKMIVKIEMSKDYFLTDYVMIGKMLKQISNEFNLRKVCNSIPFDIRQADHLISMTEFNWEIFALGKQVENQINLFDLE